MTEATERLVAERDAWRQLAIARGRILVGYRTGRTPAAGIDDAIRAEGKLRRLGIDSTTGAKVERPNNPLLPDRP